MKRKTLEIALAGLEEWKALLLRSMESSPRQASAVEKIQNAIADIENELSRLDGCFPSELFIVDIPAPRPGDSWITIGDPFPTLDSALQFAQENYGADELGNINLISVVEGVSEDDE